MKRWLCLLILGIGMGRGGWMPAASPGEEVVVVYNSAMTESRGVAEHYAKRRGVPSNQVIGLDLPESEAINRKTYLEELENPLFKELQTRHLLAFESGSAGTADSRPVPTDGEIRYVVLCYGVPVKIQEDDSLSEAASKKLRSELQHNRAAVDSELAGVFQRRPEAAFTGPLHNPHYQATNAAAMHPTNGLMLVTRLDGPDAGTARGLVDKAMQAETNGLWGRAYFDLRGISKGNYKVGDNWIRHAAEVARAVGFETALDEDPKTFDGGFPMSQIALYAGWYTANISGPLSASEVEFMPGAFAYHLHSFSAGRLRTRDQRWVGPLLARGVTATMGSVYEPYLLGTPNVGIFMSRFLGRQFRFAEAAYAAQSSLSWQTTVVGDPLYQPFGMPAPQRHQELVDRQSPLLEWSHLRIVNLNLVNGVSEASAVRYLESRGITRSSAVLQEKLATLYYAQGKLGRAIEAYQRALELEPTSQQQIRLLVELGDLLDLYQRPKEAVDTYRTLLNQFPDYPGRERVYEKMIPLLRDLDREEKAKQIQKKIQPSSGSGSAEPQNKK